MGHTGEVWGSLTLSPQVFGILAGVLLGYDAYITLPTRQGHSAAATGVYWEHWEGGAALWGLPRRFGGPRRWGVTNPPLCSLSRIARRCVNNPRTPPETSPRTGGPQT